MTISIILVYTTRPKPVKVLVEKVEMGAIEETVANTRAGTVKACRRAQMAPAMGGQIALLPVKEGDSVKQGDLLLALWNDDLQAEVGLARSEAKAAKARAESVCVQADISEKNARRKTDLRKTQAISEELVDQAVATAKSQRADCTASRTSAIVSEERVGVAEALLERTLLKAPFDGIIVEMNGEISEYVTPSPPGIPTLPAIDMVDRSCFYVVAPIDEVDAPKIKPEMKSRITLDAFKDRRFPAKVRRVADYVLDREKQARTVDIEVIFDNPDDMLEMLPGYSADAEVILRTRDNVLRVPTETIIDKQQVYVFNSDDQSLELRDVKTGLSNWDHTEITGGLEQGELVVTTVDRKGVEDGAFAIIDESEE
ncbi:MAG: efflux RND transporter periplasmic adaptor subunit [Gammaproteobacteria bacterium]|nr:efflux RND transporter periplasmic adaptor subunit [Gammaproteobacteria bacterium]MCW8923487.1 efflux RND transporter periplasmic adaptor subunit [Gammaproteobacteria bacterium]